MFVCLHWWLYAFISFAALGALIPFFYYNMFGQTRRGRKVFMGDTGSLTIGLLLAVNGHSSQYVHLRQEELSFPKCYRDGFLFPVGADAGRGSKWYFTACATINLVSPDKIISTP